MFRFERSQKNEPLPQEKLDYLCSGCKKLFGSSDSSTRCPLCGTEFNSFKQGELTPSSTTKELAQKEKREEEFRKLPQEQIKIYITFKTRPWILENDLAPEETIKKQWRKLIKIAHTDLAGGRHEDIRHINAGRDFLVEKYVKNKRGG